MVNIRKEVLVDVEMRYHCFCTKCSNSWDSVDPPTQCTNDDCKSKAITYHEITSDNSANEDPESDNSEDTVWIGDGMESKKKT